MKRTLVSLAGLCVAVLAVGPGAGAVAAAVGSGGHHGASGHVRLAEDKGPTAITVLPYR